MNPVESSRSNLLWMTTPGLRPFALHLQGVFLLLTSNTTMTRGRPSPCPGRVHYSQAHGLMATAWWSVIDFILPQTHLREEIEHDLLSAVLPTSFLRGLNLQEVIEKRLCYLCNWKCKFGNRPTPLHLLMNTMNKPLPEDASKTFVKKLDKHQDSLHN